MADGQTSSIEIESKLGDRLGALADRTGRSPKELAEEALAEYLAFKEWHVAAVEEAIREVDEGAPMVPHEEVVRWLESWGTDQELPPPRCPSSGRARRCGTPRDSVSTLPVTHRRTQQ